MVGKSEISSDEGIHELMSNTFQTAICNMIQVTFMYGNAAIPFPFFVIL